MKSGSSGLDDNSLLATGLAPEEDLGRPQRQLFRHYTFVDYATQIYSALIAVLVLLLHNGTVRNWHWLVTGHVLGLALVHWLVISYGRSESPGKLLSTFRHFYPVLTYLWFFSELGWLNRMVFPYYLDAEIVRLEQWLFAFQPSRWLMESFPYLVVSEVFYAAYFSYYVMILGVGIALFTRDRSQFFHYISILSFVFYICYILYLILPVVGPPIFYFQAPGTVFPEDVRVLFENSNYPNSVQEGVFFKLMAMLYHNFDSPGAALPSSHVAIALTTVFFSFKYLRPIRYMHLAVAIVLCVATVYCRYHYVVDVIAGLLAAAVLVPLGNRLYFKFQEQGPCDVGIAGLRE